MSLSKENKYPEIRFKGFTEAWEQRKLDELVLRKKSYPLSRSIETPNSTGYKYIHYGDIHTRVADIININSKLPNINSGNYELLNEGDLVLADASEDYQGIAMPSLLAFTPEYKLVAGLHTIVLRPKKEKVDPMFLYYLIKSPIFRKYGYRIGTGMKVFGISITNVLKFESLFPNLKEQQKISSFLNSLDSALALHQQKVDKLEKLKKAYLQDIFPKKEEMPMISFSNNQGTWKIRKFKDFIKKTGKNNKEGKDYYAYSVSNKLGLVKQSEQFEGSRLDDLSKTDYKIVLPGEFVYNPARINVGSIAYNDSETIIIVSSLYVVLKMNELLNNGYILSIIATSDFINEVKRNTEGSVREYLFFNSFRNIKFPYLNSTSDQKKIGLFFQDLNKIITLTRKKVDKLKKIKKAYLQKMFV
ncbi:Type I restriction-modification system, specificity subunit S [Marinilactibacillus psychrotolerans 42ea]|uniref:Type I restriction-modification system, specificity subunit S n=1 Tax=Marinilactibacillus psychrotolerans 42ea TaxID=1255609 RepID=A0A1R4IGR6_9LACT|nr:restriction endonuclease subunit S [Marinilactibacillus psychrotolerans]SJN19000.1 Type I restriction-modification system, specificity subunit S [Marinilactibacillus psychrotolerans 42ea]